MKRCMSFMRMLCAASMLLALAGCSDDGGTDTEVFTIEASAGIGGSINPVGSVQVAKGADRTFTITPDAGNTIEDVTVDGTSIGAEENYTFENVQSDHAINATFSTAEEGYTLAVTVDGQGSVAKSPDAAAYEDGTVVSLTAVGATDWEFDHWEGDLSGTTNPMDITMDANKSVTAVFTQGEYALAITIDGSGSVAKDPDRELYGTGAVVTLSPAGDPGWAFDHWDGDLTGTNNPATITMDDNKAVTAYFVEESYILQTFVDGGGELAIDPVEVEYAYGDVVTITATPDAGWEFDHWEGDATGSGNPLELTMDANKVVTAFFIQGQYELSLTINGTGSVTKDPDQATYTYGTVVTLTGVGGQGYAFDSWDGDATGTDNPVTVTIDGDKAVTANFVEEQYTLEIVLDGSGTVTQAPDQATYTYGTEVTLTAAPSAGWEWDQWSGDASGTDNPVTVTMDGNKTVTASFLQDEYLLNVTVDGAGSVVLDPDLATYPEGTVVTLTAVPDAGAVFNSWDGDATGASNPVQVTMDSDKSVTATFALPSILLVDDDGNDTYETYYSAALDANGFTYDVWDVSSDGSPDRLALMEYNIVVWMTGEAFENTVTSADTIALAGWLDCGGRLFMSGHDLLQGAGGIPLPPFFPDYMHITSYGHDVGASSLSGTDDEISTGLSSVSLSYPMGADYTDSLTTDGTATVSFNNQSGDPVGVKAIDGTSRVVYFAFPFEAVAHEDATTGATLMANIMGWLSEDISSSHPPPTCTITSPEDAEIVAGFTNIVVDLGESACVSHVSYNVDGGAWVDRDNPPYNYVWDSREVDNGPHTLCAQAFGFDGGSSTIDCVDVEVDQSAVGPMAKYAVVAGISDYPGGGDLSLCDEDATDWSNYLAGKGYVQEVYGDGHQNDYPLYDGEATVSNLRDAVVRMVTMADENDVVVLTFSGHGAGNGSGNSYYCAYDGNYDDDELAEDLANATAGHIFVFFDSCYSGGMIDDVMALNTSSHIYVSTTCSDNGYGYDDPSLQNGAWTGHFVDLGLKEEFYIGGVYENVAMETCHAWADGVYNPGGGDNPWEGDNDESITLHLDEPPYFPKGEFTKRARSSWNGSGAGTPLFALLEGNASLRVMKREDFHAQERTLPQASLQQAEQIQALLAQVNPDQLIKDRAPRCWFGYSMRIADSHGNDMGTLGMCYGPRGYRQDHPAVFVMPRIDGQPPVRYGLTIPDGAALANLIEERL